MPTSDDLVIRINDDDGDVLPGEEYRFDPRKFLTVEAIAAEKATGMTWAQILVQAQRGSITALAAMLWLLRKRKEPKLRFADVQFNAGQIEILDPDLDERYQPDPEPEEGLHQAAEDDEAVEGKD